MSQPSDPQIARINELSGLARTAWFSLLGYLVFVGITLLGVRDVDFFVPTRQTDLPLVGVSVPTASFFWTAPVLGAALYTYLHLFLIKLWDAHAEARTTDADATHHWLVNDFVLLRQGDPTARNRPLSFLSQIITRLLVWASAPIVLAYAWWRSMPAHNEWLTLLIAACLWLTLLVGFTSWGHAEARLGRRRTLHWSTGAQVPASGIAAIVLIAASWLRTEAGLDRYIDGAWTLADVTHEIPAGSAVLRWFTDEPLLLPLARTKLSGEALVALPADWRTPETARGAFRETWCRRQGLDMPICGQPTANDEIPLPLSAERDAWCAQHRLAGDACATHFGKLEADFTTAWEEERTSARNALRKLDLRGRDLRRAAAIEATLIGAGLREARLNGADLRWAQMEGTDLRWAQMEGADLRWARMEGADLSGARMEGADLRGARLEGAVLSGAQMEGAVLSGAQMERAVLSGAQMERAVLSGAQMEGAVLSGADLRGSEWTGASNGASPTHSADLRGAQGLRQVQLDELIGDRTTLLPHGSSDRGRPYHVWSCWETPPPDLDRIVTAAAGPFADEDARSALRARFLCGREPRHETGTPLPPDAPRPSGHPLGER